MFVGGKIIIWEMVRVGAIVVRIILTKAMLLAEVRAIVVWVILARAMLLVQVKAISVVAIIVVEVGVRLLL